VSAREISYIEAHGTGTSLGDPIEIAGLSKAFRQWTQDERFCRIGSAKSNIGHCESAAGIAGVTKVLLQMKHRALVPSLHSQTLNPHIDFERTPFVVQRELGEWKRPLLKQDGRERECARIAGISAFGAGGANAHVVIEEYIPTAEQPGIAITPVRPAIVVLSAKNEERLKERVQQILGALDSNAFEATALANIAYTLQVGREAMEERLAVLAASCHELREKLGAYLDSASGVEDIYRGTVKHGRETLATLNADEDTASLVDAWVRKGKYGKLVNLWVKGLSLDWRQLYGEVMPRRVPLPSYPFAKESYWLPGLPDVHACGFEETQWEEEWDVADEPKHSEGETADTGAAIEELTLQEKTLQQLVRLFSSVTTVSAGKLDSREPLESYGIDSVMITKLNAKLSQVFGQLSKTLFFEYPTLQELNRYLLCEHRDNCLRWSGLEGVARATQEAGTPRPREARRRSVNRTGQVRAAHEPIAIIGLSGRYPQARTLTQYWENLKTGRDCVGEIPADRWDIDGFYCEGMDAALAQGKSYCKWGGFIDGFSEFDPLFFNISPREADGMDPQERLFMQSCWEVLEDAGYTRATLADRHRGRVGVFAGITKTGFELYGPELWSRGHDGFPRTSFGSVANRVSYFLDLNGPSMPIDTMCSASLTAVHEACEHIYRGECELAIAGGVNLYLHPSSYVGMCGAKMLSATGRCRSFGAGGDGMVPGEGVGAVLLKRLSAAEADGDHIYAVIRGTSINHGGKTSGYTVPNPQAQREVIRGALDKAGVDARTVSYIEAHGTGTKLGDPIEIAGLSQAFAQDTRDKAFCAIGSVKASMGHAESAAGIAGLTKILLQMKHGQLAPSLHTQELNENIDFENSPFVVQRELGEWHRPAIAVDGESQEHARIAGISSFGAGGANAHVVLQEHVPTRQGPAVQVSPAQPALIVLSAKDEERLRERAIQLLHALECGQHRDELSSIAYTLQVGREAMEQRLALTAESLQDLQRKLTSYVNGEPSQDRWEGDVKRHREVLAAFTADAGLNEVIRGWVRHGKYGKLLDLWSKGLNVDWSLLYDGVKPVRVSLPVYPFARNQYWLAADAGARVENRFEDECLQALLDDFVTDEMSIDDAVTAAKELMSA
jgi:acyl transferase domain-containing protein